MSKAPLFLLDSDVFIAAKNAYYAFEICPGLLEGRSPGAPRRAGLAASIASETSCLPGGRRKTSCSG